MLARQIIYFLTTVALLLFISSCNRKEEQKLMQGSEAERLGKIGNTLIKKGELDSAILILEKAVTQIGAKQTLGTCFNSLGFCYDSKSKYQKAIENYLKASNLFIESRDTVKLAQAQLNTAICFSIIGINDKAIAYALKAEKIFRRGKEYQSELAISYNLLGSIHSEIRNYPLSLNYHQQSLNIRSVKTNNLSIAPSLNNIGEVYRDQKQYDSAIRYYSMYLIEAKNSKNTKKMGRGYENLARVYLLKENRILAKENMDSSQVYYDQAAYEPGKVYLHLLKSEYFTETALAEKEAKLALKQSIELSMQMEELDALLKLEKISNQKGNQVKAYHYARGYHRLKDSLENVEKIGRIYALEMLSQIEQKNEKIQSITFDKQISEQKRKVQRVLLYLTLIIILLLTLLAVILFKRYRAKKLFVEEYFSSEEGIILKTGRKLSFQEILKVESIRNNLIIQLEDSELKEKNTTLKEFYSALPKIEFGRAQHGVVVNFNAIENVQKKKLTFRNSTFNISATYSEEFHKQYHLFATSRMEGKIVLK